MNFAFVAQCEAIKKNVCETLFFLVLNIEHMHAADQSLLLASKCNLHNVLQHRMSTITPIYSGTRKVGLDLYIEKR